MCANKRSNENKLFLITKLIMFRWKNSNENAEMQYLISSRYLILYFVRVGFFESMEKSRKSDLKARVHEKLRRRNKPWLFYILFFLLSEDTSENLHT